MPVRLTIRDERPRKAIPPVFRASRGVRSSETLGIDYQGPNQNLAGCHDDGNLKVTNQMLLQLPEMDRRYILSMDGNYQLR